MNVQPNQVPSGTTLLGPGVERRVATIVRRGEDAHLVPGTHVTMDELHRYQLLGRRLQARATAAALAGLARALVWPVRRLVAGFRRARREGVAIRQLGALDDHLLADIGLSRSQIPAAVAGLLDRPAAPAPAAPVATLTPRSGRTATDAGGTRREAA